MLYRISYEPGLYEDFCFEDNNILMNISLSWESDEQNSIESQIYIVKMGIGEQKKPDKEGQGQQSPLQDREQDVHERLVKEVVCDSIVCCTEQDVNKQQDEAEKDMHAPLGKREQTGHKPLESMANFRVVSHENMKRDVQLVKPVQPEVEKERIQLNSRIMFLVGKYLLSKPNDMDNIGAIEDDLSKNVHGIGTLKSILYNNSEVFKRVEPQHAISMPYYQLLLFPWVKHMFKAASEIVSVPSSLFTIHKKKKKKKKKILFI